MIFTLPYDEDADRAFSSMHKKAGHRNVPGLKNATIELELSAVDGRGAQFFFDAE